MKHKKNGTKGRPVIGRAKPPSKDKATWIGLTLPQHEANKQHVEVIIAKLESTGYIIAREARRWPSAL